MVSTLLNLLLLIPVFITLGMLVLVYTRRQAQNAGFLFGYLAGGLIGVSCYALELAASSLPWKMFWHTGYYLGMALFIPFFLCFSIRYKYSGLPFRPVWLVAIFLPGALILLLEASNPLHYLFYRSVWLETSGDWSVMLKINGPLYSLSMLWAYGFSIASITLLVSFWRNSSSYYHRQTLIIIISMLLPLLANGLYLFHLRPFGGLNITPFATMLTGLACTWAVMHYRLFDLAPIAYSLVFEKIPFGVIVLDDRGRIADINPAAQSDFGVTHKQVIGESLERLSDENQAPLQTLLDESLPENRELSLVLSGQERIFVVDQASFKYQFARRGKDRSGRIILLRDNTSRRDLLRRQIEQQRKNDILQERERLSNDLHDGLGQIMGYTSLQLEAALISLGSGQTGMAQATLARLVEVTRAAQTDLRAFILGMRQGDEAVFFTADEQHSAALESPDRSLGAVLTNYCEQFSAHFGLPVRLSLPAAISRLTLDPDRENHLLRILKEALTNIRTHAQATQARVTLFLDPEAIELIVEDDGLGFNPSLQMQSPPALSVESPPGAQTGHFGLQIMRARAIEMGGSLEIRSAPGQGATLILRVPRPSAGPLPKLAALSVLLVDDQPLFRSGLRNLLTARGLQVVGEASDGDQAIQLAESLHPNLILMDCRMPGISGVEATRRIKASLPDTRVVMLTVEEDKDTLIQAIHAGASGYLLKDMKPDEFFIMLEALARGEMPISPALAVRMISETAHALQNSGVQRLSSRQVKILELALQGLTNQEIGDRLSLSESSVKYQLRQIFDILHVRSRDEALAVAQKRGFIH